MPAATGTSGRWSGCGLPGRHGRRPLAGAAAAGGAGAGAGRPRPPHAELAAERSAGALTYNAAPEATAWARSVLGSGPLLAVEQAVAVEEDPAEARRIGRECVAFYLTLPNYARAWERAGFGPEELGNGGSDRLVDATVAWGSPDAIADRVQVHLDAGADHVCLQVLDTDPNALPVGAWRALAPAVAGR